MYFYFSIDYYTFQGFLRYILIKLSIFYTVSKFQIGVLFFFYLHIVKSMNVKRPNSGREKTEN